MQTRSLAALISICALFPASGALAQATPADGAELVRLMHDQYVGRWYRTLTFTQATLRRTAADTMAHETWYEAMKLPGRLRIDVGAHDGNPVILFARDSIYIRRGAQLMPPRAGRNILLVLGFDIYGQPVSHSVSQLRDEGFDLTRIHDDTWQGRRVFVVGAGRGDTTSKQLWVDAERMVFVRMLAPPGPGAAGTEEVRFDDYQRAGGGWLATLVTATRAGRLQQREQYSDIRVDSPVDDRRLDPANLARP